MARPASLPRFSSVMTCHGAFTGVHLLQYTLESPTDIRAGRDVPVAAASYRKKPTSSLFWPHCIRELHCQRRVAGREEVGAPDAKR